MSAVSEVAQCIVDEGLGVLGTDLFLDRLPDTPDAATALIQYSGRAPQYVHNGVGVNIDYPLIQCTVRHTSTAAAWSKIESIYFALAKVVNKGNLLRIEPNAPPFLLHRDENERTVYVFNMQVTRGV